MAPLFTTVPSDFTYKTLIQRGNEWKLKAAPRSVNPNHEVLLSLGTVTVLVTCRGASSVRGVLRIS